MVAVLALAPAPLAAQTPGGALLDPPIVDGQPVKVAIGLVISNLAKIDEASEQFLIDGYLFMHWRDPRLVHPRRPGGAPMVFEPGQIWLPKPEFLNAVTPRDRHDTGVTVDDDGRVSYTERFDVELSTKFLLRNFPFDSQTLQIVIHPFLGSHLQMVVYTLDRDATWKSNQLDNFSSLAEWKVAAMTPTAGRIKLANGVEISELRFDIKVVRRYGFYVWKVFLPLFLMVMLSWTVFWIETFDLQNQIQVAVVTLLTVIAFALAISSSLPRVSYLTFADAFFLTCYIFVFLAILELMTVHVTHRTRGKDPGLKIRHISRWLIPLAFCATLAVIVVRFLT